MGQNHCCLGRSEIVSEPSPFHLFPVDCISIIISFTSQRDACVAASVSKIFESAANSDIVWEKFIPQEYESLVPPSRSFSSKKELYFSLCNNPFLIENGTKSLWLEKVNGKRCIMLSAMSVNISIIWGEDTRYWQWIQIPEARFERVAELIEVWWFEIRGSMNTRLLSPRTHYSVYIVFKKRYNCYGFENVAIEAGVGVVGQETSRRFICFDATQEIQRRNLVKPEKRQDGWMEIELGDFFNEGELDEIEMSVLESTQLNRKCGLIIHGIEIRPAKIQY